MFRHEPVPFVQPKHERSRTQWELLPALFLLAVLLWLGQAPENPRTIQVTYAEFQTLVREGRIVKVFVLGDRVRGVLDDPVQSRPNTDPNSHVTTGLPTSRHRDRLESFLAQQGALLIVRPVISRPRIGPI